MQIYRIRHIVPLLISAILLGACSFSLAEDITPPPGAVQAPAESIQPAPLSGPLYPLVPPNPEDGRAIYAEKCAPCHGASGMGDGERAAQLPNPVPALGAEQVARQAAPESWYTMVTQGNLERFMPPFSSLSADERWDVVAYALSLSLPPEVVARGAELYQAECADCHGAGGKGDGPQAASLTTVLPDLIDQELLADKSAADLFQVISAGAAPDMPAFTGQLAEDEIWALTAYLRDLTFTRDQGDLAVGGTPDPAETAALAEDGAVQGTPLAAAEGKTAPGTVSGSVVNLSNQEPPQALEVTLLGYDQMVPVITHTTSLQPDGKYIFTDVEMPDGRAFLATVDYKGTIYTSDIAIAQAGADTLDLPISIYESTTDTSKLSADRLHIFLEFVDASTVRVIELYILSNPTNMVMVPAGDGQPTISFKLPPGAANLQFQDGVLGERFVQTADGFGDTASIRPGVGTSELLFAFEMPYDRKLELVQQVPVPVNAVVVLAPEDGVNVKDESLVDEGTRDVQGAQYRLYDGGSISAGAELSLTVTGRPASGSPQLTTGSTTNLVVGLGAFGLALVVAGVWLYRRRRAVEPLDEEDESRMEGVPGVEPNAESVESLMDAIIALDDLYQSGQLPESAYLERRSKLKEHLKDKMEQGGE